MIYYISTSGNGTNNGTSIATPWDLEKLNDSIDSIVSGDSILFKKGDVFYGSVNISVAGITVSYYGTGDNPVITGFVSITEWVNKGGNIWESADAVSGLTTCNCVVINGENKPMGRWPNHVPLPSNLNTSDGSWIYGSTFTGHTALSNPALDSSVINWTGAEVVIRTRKYNYQRSRITSHVGNVITFTAGNGYNPGSSSGFFIQDDVRTLDQVGEWYYNPTTKKLSVYSLTQPVDVKITTVNDLFTINASNMIVDGISVKGANQNGIKIGEVSDITIQNCNIDFTFNGIYCNSGHLSERFNVLKNTVHHSQNNGIDLHARYVLQWGYFGSLIQDNIISNSGILPGMGSSLDNDYAGIHIGYITDSVVRYNHVTNSGHNGIDAVGADNITIDKNFVNYYCLLLDDGGGIYTNTAGGYKNITNNIVLNGIGNIQGINSYPNDMTYGYNSAHGIYSDDGGDTINVSIIDNTIYNASQGGIFWSKTNNIIIRGNTLYSNRIGIYNGSIYTKSVDYIAVIRDNISFSSRTGISTENRQEGELFFGDGTGVYSPLIDMDNNYYCRPKDQDNSIYVYPPGGEEDRHVSLAYWQTFSGKDANSHYFPREAEDNEPVYFHYNATKEVSLIKLTVPMIDATGKVYQKAVLLCPYSSIILMENI